MCKGGVAVTIYESIKEFCLDLDYEVQILNGFTELSNGEYEIMFTGVDMDNVRSRITENKYYDKQIVRRTPETISLVEKQYIDDRWVWALMYFEEVPAGVNMIYRVLSVPFFSEYGANINVESAQIANALRREELSDIVG